MQDIGWISRALALTFYVMLTATVALSSAQLKGKWKLRAQLELENELHNVISLHPRSAARVSSRSTTAERVEEEYGSGGQSVAPEGTPARVETADIVAALRVASSNIGAMRQCLLMGSGSSPSHESGSEREGSESEKGNTSGINMSMADSGSLSRRELEPSAPSNVNVHYKPVCLAALVCALVDNSDPGGRALQLSDASSGLTALGSWKFYKVLHDSIQTAIHFTGDNSSAPGVLDREGSTPTEQLPFGALCLRVFATLESFFGCALPLFVEDNPELDTFVSSTQMATVELLIFLMVVAATSEENGAAGPRQPSLKGVYSLRCVSAGASGADEDGVAPTEQDGGDGATHAARIAKTWYIALQITMVESKAARQRSNKYRAGISVKRSVAAQDTSDRKLKGADESSNRAQQEAKGDINGTLPQTDADDQSSLPTPTSVLLRLVNILGQRHFGATVEEVGSSEVRAPPGLFRVSWRLKIENCAAVSVHHSIRPFLSPGLASPFAEDGVGVGEGGGAPVEYEYRQCWLYVDSQLGDQLRLFTVKDRIMAFGVPMNSCQMFDLYKYKCRHPVVVVYEDVLSKFKHQLKSDLAPISSTIIVLCEQSVRTVDELSSLYDIKVTACLSFSGTLNEVARCVHWAAFVAEPRAQANAKDVSVATVRGKQGRAVPTPGVASPPGRLGMGQNDLFKVAESRHALQKFAQTRRLESTRVAWNGFILALRQVLAPASEQREPSAEKVFMLSIIDACLLRVQAVNPGVVSDFHAMRADAASGASDAAVFALIRGDRAKKLKFLSDAFVPVVERMFLLESKGSPADLLELAREAEVAALTAGRVGLSQLSCWFTVVQDLVVVVAMHYSLTASAAVVASSTASPGHIRTRSSEAVISTNHSKDSHESRRKLPPVTVPRKFKFSSRVYQLDGDKGRGTRIVRSDSLTSLAEGSDEAGQTEEKEQDRSGEEEVSMVSECVPAKLLVHVREMVLAIEGIVCDMMYSPDDSHR